MIQPIPTFYKGYKFRSRLEARWAVFLTELGWKWLYESEGFILDDGTYYLPDFFIPQLNTWVEVKPNHLSVEEMNKCILLSRGKPDDIVLLAVGMPELKTYECLKEGEKTPEATLSSFIRKKGWNSPYFYGDWELIDKLAEVSAKQENFQNRK